MARRIIKIFAVLMLLAGLSLLLYPTVSNYFQTVKHRRAIFNYLESVEELSDEDYTEILRKAEEYNKRLVTEPLPVMNLTVEQLAEYNSLLDITGTGLMGYIRINKADVYLPVYHGTSESVLQVGAGHIEGTSLPIGGESTHSMISGHRGLPSAMLFTNLDKLQEGDRFTINILYEAYTYEVYEIETVLPEEVHSLGIERGKDRCTLVTCTPYGVNTHRLLIRGRRVTVPVAEEEMLVQSGAKMIDMVYLIAIVDVPVLILTVILSATAYRRRVMKNKQVNSQSTQR